MRKKVLHFSKIAVVIGLAILITFILMKVSILIGNDLVIKLSPLDNSLTINYPEHAHVNFSISSINAAFCAAECNYTMDDVSTGEIADQGSFLLETGQTVYRTYQLSGKVGSGQNIYNFRVECANQRRLLCLSEGHTSSRVALITLNYEPTPYEQALKIELKQNVSTFLGQLANIDKTLQRLSLQLESAGAFVNTANLSAEIEGIHTDFSRLHVSAKNLRTLWHGQNYTYLAKSFNQSYFDDIHLLEQRMQEFETELKHTVSTHNTLLQRAKNLHDRQDEYVSAQKIAALTHNSALDADAKIFLASLNKTLASIYEKTFKDYNELAVRIQELEDTASTLHERSAVPDLLVEGKYQVFTEYDYLCQARAACFRNFSLYEMQPLAHASPTDSIRILSATCNEIEELARLHSAPSTSEHYNNPDFAILQKFTKANVRIHSTNTYAQEKNSITSLGMLWTEILRTIPNQTANILIPLTNETLLSLSTLEILQAADINFTAETLAFNKSMCIPLEINHTALFPITTLSNVSIPEITINESEIPENISDNPPICCVFGNCQECCSYPSCTQENYPIIFLHGHAIDRMNSPEYSLDTFNKIQRKLQKDGYVNAGIVSLSTNLSQYKKGEWGISGAPVSVKISYYYDIYYDNQDYVLYPKKTESVETYAIRLKELIDIVKYRTGQDKVIIVAHSMGGLVGRRYLQIFDETSVDKLILIGTPNKGIDEDLLSYCALFGGGNECGDMAQNSAFIKKLNDPSQQPHQTKIYTIAGSGCAMNGGDGDGLVLYSSATLPFGKNYNLKGACPTFVNLLHAEMIDPDKYPETYERLTEILKE